MPATQRLGQHFLKSEVAIKKIVAALDLKKSDVVLEVGPGHGELTGELARECSKTGCTLVAIEKDSELANELSSSKTFSAEDVKIIKGDVLKILPTVAANKIVGNIPYYITGKLLRTIGELKNKPRLCVLTVQKEVAERISERPPKMNRLAASVQFWAAPKIIGLVPKQDFLPSPKVDSAILFLEVVQKEKTPEVGDERYYRAVRSLFAQPRKTILNNLVAGGEIKKEKILGSLEKLGVDPQARPQNLTIEMIAALAEALF